MALSKKQSAVLYTTLIIALDQIIKEEFLRDLVARVYTWDDPAWHNLTLSFEATAAQTGAKPFHSPRTSFYLKTLPPQVLVSAVLVFLDLYWNAALEYVFPARPRGKEVSFEEKKDGGESLRDNDTPGKRSIVRGKPRRPSLSWRNTLVKWILDMSVGLVLHWTAFHIIHGIVYLEGFAATLEVVKKELIFDCLQSFFTLGRFASLIGFAILPVYQRVVLVAAVDTLSSITIHLFLEPLFKWVFSTDFGQALILSGTNGTVQGAHTIDEL